MLAIDQTYDERQETRKSALGNTATLELTPHQADTVAARGRGGYAVAVVAPAWRKHRRIRRRSRPHRRAEDDNVYDGGVAVIRYGIAHASTNRQPESAGE